MLICKDNHILCRIAELIEFQSWVKTKYNPENVNAINPNRDTVVKATGDVLIKFTQKIEKIDETFYVLEVSVLIDHLNKLLAGQDSTIKLTAYNDIRKISDITNIDLTFHKNKTFMKSIYKVNNVEIDPVNLELYQIILASSSYVDTQWKAKKAIIKNSKDAIDQQVRLCYIGQAIIDNPDFEEELNEDSLDTEIEQILSVIPGIEFMSPALILNLKNQIKRSAKLLAEIRG